MTDTYYVLVCRECGGSPIPFPTAAKRGKWATAHTAETGHESWQVTDHMISRQSILPEKGVDVGPSLPGTNVGVPRSGSLLPGLRDSGEPPPK